MRVAVWEPNPRTMGPASWAAYVTEGLRRLGHDAVYLTATHSGRPRIAWGRVDTARDGFKMLPKYPDLIVKTSELEATLNGCDLVILTEPRNAPDERDARKANETPRYIETLRRLTVPWTTYLHGAYYEDGRSPWLATALETDSFSGRVVTPQVSYAGPILSSHSTSIVEPCLPYVPRSARDSDRVPSATRIGMLGRVVTNKGQQFLMHPSVHDGLPDGWDLEFSGPAVIMRSPTMSYLIYLMLQDWGPGAVELPDWMADKPEAWQVFRGFPWLRDNGHRFVRYRGAFADPIAEHWRRRVYVNLTSKTFSTGLIEYSGLEAMDAGCVIVAPENRLTAADYAASALWRFEEPPGIRGGQRAGDPVTLRAVDPAVTEELTGALDEATRFGDATRVANARHNRELLYTAHDPTRTASALLEAGL